VQPVVFRPGVPEDAPTLARLYAGSIAETFGAAAVAAPAPLTARLARALRRGDPFVMVAEVLGMVVGYGSLGRLAPPVHGCTFELLALHVAPAQRGRGVGGGLAARLLARVPAGEGALVRSLGWRRPRLYLGLGGSVVGEGWALVGGQRVPVTLLVVPGTGGRDAREG
jgi:ribosomal protein S18 acetylase RimI-like enzyme